MILGKVRLLVQKNGESFRIDNGGKMKGIVFCLILTFSPGRSQNVAPEKRVIVLMEIEDSGADVFRTILREAASTYHLRFCEMSCDRRQRWHRNKSWRHSCQMLVGGYTGGVCPGGEYYSGEGNGFLPCHQYVSLRHPVSRVLSSYLSCQKDESFFRVGSVKWHLASLQLFESIA